MTHEEELIRRLPRLRRLQVWLAVVAFLLALCGILLGMTTWTKDPVNLIAWMLEIPVAFGISLAGNEFVALGHKSKRIKEQLVYYQDHLLSKPSA